MYFIRPISIVSKNIMIKTLDQYYININRICGHQILKFDDNENMSETKAIDLLLKNGSLSVLRSVMQSAS